MLWQPSPQYQNMPRDQYMQTDEGKRSQQAFAQWGNWVNQGMQNAGQQNSQSTGKARPPSGKVDMSVYAPGNAQPVQPQSQGAQYAAQQRMPLPSNTSSTGNQNLPDFGDDMRYGQDVNYSQENAYRLPATVNYAPSPDGGTMPFAPPQRQTYYDRKGQPVADPTQVATFRPTYYDMTGKPVSFDQQQAQRAAALVQTQQADMPFRLANVFNQNIGSNALDYNSVLGQANKMVENGFYNPFSAMYGQGQGVGGTPDIASRVSQYAPPSIYGGSLEDRGPLTGWATQGQSSPFANDWRDVSYGPPPTSSPGAFDAGPVEPANKTAQAMGRAQPVPPPSQGDSYGEPAAKTEETPAPPIAKRKAPKPAGRMRSRWRIR